MDDSDEELQHETDSLLACNEPNKTNTQTATLNETSSHSQLPEGDSSQPDGKKISIEYQRNFRWRLFTYTIIYKYNNVIDSEENSEVEDEKTWEMICKNIF